MSNYYLKDAVRNTALNDLDIDSASGSYEWAPGVPVDVFRVGFSVETAITHGGAGATVDIYYRPTAGASGSQVLIDQWLIVPMAAGKVAYKDIVVPVAESTAIDGSKVNVGPDGPQRIPAGGSIFFDVNSQGTAGAGRLFIEYWKLPFAGDAIANAIKDNT